MRALKAQELGRRAKQNAETEKMPDSRESISEKSAIRLVRRPDHPHLPPLSLLLSLFQPDPLEQSCQIGLARLAGDLPSLSGVTVVTLAAQLRVADVDETLARGVVPSRISSARWSCGRRSATCEHTLELVDTECAIATSGRAAAPVVRAAAGSAVGRARVQASRCATEGLLSVVHGVSVELRR